MWDDILRCGKAEAIVVHFVGSVVYVESGLSQVTHLSPLLVIDGQQRLTTVTLLLAALANAAGERELFDGFTARKIRNYYLLNPEEDGERYYKLLLSQTDRETLKSIVGQKELPREHSLRIKENFNLFSEWLSKPSTDLQAVCKGLAKLVVVDIALNREQDNPQLIFESMNSTGKELSQADLIRNFVLMGLEPKLQERLYTEYWRPMELDFGQEGYGEHFDGFMRHYLTIKTGEIPRTGDVYESFKGFARDYRNANSSEIEDVEFLLKGVHQASKDYCAIALDRELVPHLRRAFRELRELRVDVTYPLLLELYADYRAEKLSVDHFEEVVRMIESYVFRRAACEIPTNSYNKTFATFMRSVDKEKYLESIKAQFLLLPSYKRFPTNEEFYRRLQDRDLYNFRNRSYWLRRFEAFERKEQVVFEEYTVEHILPQNTELNEDWQKDLGCEWPAIQEKWLHTLGNLTLTGYNSEYSDRSFIEKRDIKGGFAQSPLKLNSGLQALDHWNENTIKQRAEQLAEEALRIWKYPAINEAVLQSYQKSEQKDADSHRSVEDLRYMSEPYTRELFEAVRKEILSLDACVNEFIKARYVAYKAETNFVHISPQSKRLRLSLYMKIDDLHDPKGIAKDYSEKGRWNADVTFKLNTLEELPYAMGLIRQSLERQLGD